MVASDVPAGECVDRHIFSLLGFCGGSGSEQDVSFSSEQNRVRNMSDHPPQNKQRGFPSEQLQTSTKRLQIHLAAMFLYPHLFFFPNSVLFITGFKT